MKTTLTLMTLSFAMSACVYNEELADVADLYPTKQNTILPYSMITPNKGEKTSSSRSIPNEAFAQVSILIRNQMPDFHLTVEGIRLCNIHLTGTYHFASEEQAPYWETDATTGTLALETRHLKIGPNEEALVPQEGSIAFIPQSGKSWNPTILPQQSKGCYLLLDCKVSCEATLWGDKKGNSTEAAIPLSVHFPNNQPSVIVLTLAPNCPWYDVRGTSPQPLFVPITFDVSVKDWKEQLKKRRISVTQSGCTRDSSL